MGGVLGVVLAHIARAHLDDVADRAHQVADEVDGGVLDEYVLVGVDGVAHVERVAYGAYLAHVLGGVAVVDIIAGAEVAHELDGGGVLGQVVVVKIGLQHAALQGSHVADVLKGRGDGQVVRVVYAGRLDYVDHLQDESVRVLHVVAEEAGRVDNEVVALAVGHQHAAIPVEDVAARGGDGLGADLGVQALVVVRGALDYLHLIERAHAQSYKQRDNEAKGHDS